MFRNWWKRLGDAEGRRVVAALAIICVLAPAPARAQQMSEAAREQYRLATIHYNLGKYVEAAHEYEAAYEATGDPAMLFNIGQAYRLAGELKRAVTMYRSYLRTAPTGEKRHLAESLVAELEATIKSAAPLPNTTTKTTTPEVAAPPAPPAAPPEQRPAAAPVLAAPPPAQEEPAVAMIPRRQAPVVTKKDESSRGGGHTWLWIAGGALLAGVAAVVVVASRGTAGAAEPQTDLGTMRF